MLIAAFTHPEEPLTRKLRSITGGEDSSARLPFDDFTSPYVPNQLFPALFERVSQRGTLRRHKQNHWHAEPLMIVIKCNISWNEL
ncbi:hypothetical protein A0H81_11481 [Grifola frondosa]|uniref:Uncharacterized protein n=1 Tax=Grifola frondosa TaxID=5627 RepID=A0A1C7LUH6_GRIFR|nr:hypothetical protein A0H81_11481 [Grifola frondosa]